MERIYELSSLLFQGVKESLNDIKYNSKDKQHIYSMALYGTIIENASSCMLLFENNHYTSIPIILRNMLEAYIDLSNLIDDESYHNNMNIAFNLQKKRFAEHAIESFEANEDQYKIIKREDLEKSRAESTEIIDRLKMEGYKNLRIRDRFDKTDIGELYHSLYGYLCQEAHNNINMLEKRHLEVEDGIKVKYFAKWPIMDQIQLIHFYTALLVLAFRKVQIFFDLKETRYSAIVAEVFVEFKRVEEEKYKNWQEGHITHICP